MSSYALRDILPALANARFWGYLAFKQIQFEYRRSYLGSVWIALSFAIPAAAIGSLMAQLQGRTLQEHVPYVLFGFAAWGFISSMITGGSTVLKSAKPYLLQMPLQRSIFVLSLLLKNFYLLAIQTATAALVALLFGWRPDYVTILWILPAMGFYLAAGFGTATFFGHICARFPDLQPLVGSIMRLSFFFTPIIWHPGSGRDEIGGLVSVLMDWNPFTHALLIYRDGLLGGTPAIDHWVVMAGLTPLALILGLVALELLGRRIAYWL